MFQCHLEMEKSPACFLFYRSAGEGQVVAAGEGQTRQGLQEGRVWRHRSHQGEGGVERQGGPWFLDSPPGPRWETWEGASVAGAQGACVVSPVLGCGWSGKSWQASGAGGEGQLPLIQEESEQRAHHPRLLGLKVFPDLHVLVELSLQRQVVLERLPLTSVGFVPCSG